MTDDVDISPSTGQQITSPGATTKDEQGPDSSECKLKHQDIPPAAAGTAAIPEQIHSEAALSNADIKRYSRQLLVPPFGVAGQRALQQSSVLVVGAGGLGCPVLMYLSGAGVGLLGIVDFDQVDESNLHRQVLYREEQHGRSKAQCAAEALRLLNSGVRYSVHEEMLSHDNALRVLAGYDVVVDASDNPHTRYLLNDACVIAGKPLVSGSALGLEGQVTVYNYQGGPCYRCVYPMPFKHEAARSCSDNGVLGPVPGLLGCLQAMEVVKVLAGFGEPLSGRLCSYDASDGTFAAFKLRPRREDCAVCGEEPSIHSMEESRRFGSQHGLTVARCPMEVPGDLPTVCCQEYKALRDRGSPHVLLDVRVPVQYQICSLPGSVNVPLHQLQDRLEEVRGHTEGGSKPVYCLCRRGIDSRRAVKVLLACGGLEVFDISGGLQHWRTAVDTYFPEY